MKRSRLLPWLRSWSFLSYLLNGVLMAQMILLPCSSCKGVWITFDSDGDGIFETGYDDGTLPSDDSVPPTADPTEPETPLPPTGDADGDGLNNADESAAGSNPYNPDSDFDGLTDAVETSLTGTDPASTDSNHDGISDYNGFYGNTAVDQDLVGPGETPYDFDGDGLNDPVDPDPLSPSNDPDSDGDYVPDSQDTDPTNPTEWNDANHNGINDDAEIPNNDIDGDGISNDTDSHPTDPYLSNDWNYNGGNDQNEDWDGDGVSNLQDSHPNTNCQWCDWNGNGVNDDSESGSADSDGDGYSDNSDSHSYNSSLWEDWNGNGTNDSQESQNSDGDGYPDGSDSDPYNSSLWEDWNRNGSNDSQESQDSDGDGRNDSSDSDPQNISLWEDWNRNGANDSSETTQPSQDSDGDGYPDGSDTDPSSSNLWEDNNRNGYNDSNEDQFIDNDQDGRINAFDSHPNDASLWNDQNNNGQNDENEITIVDTDGDGYADSLDTHPDDPQRWNDHNNNGSNDELDVPADTDSDGLPDAQDPSPSDSDNDGLTNTEEVLNGTNPNNSDTDSDGSPDGVEQLTGTNPVNVDTDGDGLTDNEEQQAYFTDPLVPNPNSFSDTSNPPAAPSEGNDESLPASNPDSSNTPSETPPVNNPPTESPPTNNPPVDNPPPNDPQEPPQIKVFIQENENSADGIDSAYPAQSGETTSFPSLSLDKMQGDLTKTIFIRNDGEADLALGELIKSGPNSSEFSFSLFNPTSPSPTASLSLASNSVASLKVTFSAKPALAKISQTAILRIPSNDPIKNHFDITLTSIVPAGIWQSEGAYFSADLRDSDGDGIPDLVADMYKPLKVSATGDLDGDGVNNLSQYRQGRDLLNNVVTSDIDMDGLINQTEETWAKAYPGLISKYKFEDAYVDPDKDGLLTIEELNCTWGDPKVKDPAAVATNPFVKSTGPNNSGGTAALKSALTYKLTSRSAPANTTDPKLNWSYREADQVYAEWMNDGLLRRAYRASATNGIYPADFFAPRYSEIAPATATSTMNEVRGYDHLPLGYLRWLEKEIFPKIAVNVIPNIRIASTSAPINGKVPIAPWQVKNELETFMAVNDDTDVDRMPNVWEARYQLNWRMPTDGGFVQALASIDSRTKALKLTAADTLNLQRTGNTQSTLQALIQQHLSESFAASGQMMNNPNRTPNSRVIQLVNEYPIDRKVPAVLPAPPAASASALIQGAWRAKCDAWLSAFTAYHVWPYLAEIDPDHDGLVNADEYFLDLNPNLADFTGTADRDTDKDGFTDAQELAAGTDSTKATSKPKLTLKVISGANQSGRPHGMIPHPIFIQSVYQGDKGGFCPAPGTIVTISAPNQFTLLTVINGSQTAASVAKENWIPKSLKLTTDLQGKAQFSLKLPHLKGTVTLGLIATQAALKTANVPITLSIVPDSLDTDGDGMSDAWEVTHKLTKTNALDADVSPLHLSPAYHRDTPVALLSAAQQAILALPRETSADLALPGLLKDYPLVWTASSLQSKEQIILLKKVDPDHDGLTNFQEYLLNSNPQKADAVATGARDSDGDGFTNAEELLHGTSAILASSMPPIILEMISGNNQEAVAGGILPEPLIVRVMYDTTPNNSLDALTPRAGVPLNFNTLFAGTSFQDPMTTEITTWKSGSLTMVTKKDGLASVRIKLPPAPNATVRIPVTTKMQLYKSLEFTEKVSPASNQTGFPAEIILKDTPSSVNALAGRFIGGGLSVAVRRKRSQAEDQYDYLGNVMVTFISHRDTRFYTPSGAILRGSCAVMTDAFGSLHLNAVAPTELGNADIVASLANGSNVAVTVRVMDSRAGSSLTPGTSGGRGPVRNPAPVPVPSGEPNPPFEIKVQQIETFAQSYTKKFAGLPDYYWAATFGKSAVKPMSAQYTDVPPEEHPDFCYTGMYGNCRLHAYQPPYTYSDGGTGSWLEWNKGSGPEAKNLMPDLPGWDTASTAIDGKINLGLSEAFFEEFTINGHYGSSQSTSESRMGARLMAVDSSGKVVSLPQGYKKTYLVLLTKEDLDNNSSKSYQMLGPQELVIPPNTSYAFSNEIYTSDIPNLPFPSEVGVNAWITFLPVEVAVDADRNGQIEFGKDTTSADKPYEFWVNHDRDIGHTVDGDDWEEDDVQGNETAETWDIFEPGLKWRRDLEDLTRVWIDLSGFGSALNTHDANIKLYARMEPSAGDPQMTLYQVVEADGGRKYLTDNDTGYSQTQIYYGEELCTVVNTPQGNEVPRRAWEDLSADKAIHLLFEGKFAGKGKLIFEFRKGGQVFATMPPVFLNLKNVEDMYETWTVGDVTEQGEHYNIWPAASATKTTGQNLPTPKTSQEKDYFLFVHGWNMSPFDKDVFAATAFKRLWHQGYKGRFGAFRWPTFWFAAPVPNTDNFDGSEQRAWNSGAPLAGLASQLSSIFQEGGQSKVRLYAHSMGNIVASECLRQSAQASKVHTYIAAQAALSSHVWDNTTPLMPFTVGGNAFGGGPETPDIYGYYWEAGATTQPHEWQAEGRPSYMDPRYMPSGVRYINHYNPYDWALSFGRWQVNQMLKPDVGYHYSIMNPFNLTDLNKRFWKAQTTRLDFPDDRLEIFSFAAESHSYATGQQGSTGGMFGAAVDLNAAPYSFGSAHKGHSAQFRSSIQKLWLYWKRVIDDMRITVP